MSEKYLLNYGTFYGQIHCQSIEEKSNETCTLLIDSIAIIKTAEKEIWIDDGSYLEYNIKITNDASNVVYNAKFKDQLDTELVDIVQNSVYVNEKQVSYDYSNGFLTVDLGTLPLGSTIITFQVKKVRHN